MQMSPLSVTALPDATLKLFVNNGLVWRAAKAVAPAAARYCLSRGVDWSASFQGDYVDLLARQLSATILGAGDVKGLIHKAGISGFERKSSIADYWFLARGEDVMTVSPNPVVSPSALLGSLESLFFHPNAETACVALRNYRRLLEGEMREEEPIRHHPPPLLPWWMRSLMKGWEGEVLSESMHTYLTLMPWVRGLNRTLFDVETRRLSRAVEDDPTDATALRLLGALDAISN